MRKLMRQLLEHRTHRGWWVWLIWLAFYVPVGAMAASDIGGNSRAAFVLYLIPPVLVFSQWAWPTLLVWGLLSLPALLYMIVCVYAFAFSPPDGISFGPALAVAGVTVIYAFFVLLAWPSVRQPRLTDADSASLLAVSRLKRFASECRLPRVLVSGALGLAALRLLAFASAHYRTFVYRDILAMPYTSAPPGVLVAAFVGLDLLALLGIGYVAQPVLRTLARPFEVVVGIVGALAIFEVLQLVMVPLSATTSLWPLTPSIALGSGAILRFIAGRRSSAVQQALPADGHEV